MSLLIVTVEKDRALVAVDTKGSFVTAPGAEPVHTLSVSKLYPFVAAGVVMACRGTTDYLSTLLAACSAHHFAGFDEFELALPNLLAVVEVALCRRYEQMAVANHLDLARIEVCIIGASRSTGSMRAKMFARTSSERGFVPEAIEQEWIQPWIWEDDDHQPPIPSSVSEVARIARAQMAWCERASPGQAAVGGSLIVVEMSSAGDLHIFNTGDFVAP